MALLDVKRGDIGSTMDAYAAAYLSDGSPLAADAITLNPYLGFGSLRSAIDLAREQGRGVYVLALTSNPEGAEVQRAEASDGRTVARSILDAAAEANADVEYGHVGLVVGVTVGPTDLDFASLGGSILAPGFGAQGGTVDDLEAVFGSAVSSVLPASSRELMSAGPNVAPIRARARSTLGRIAAAARVG